MWLLRQVGYEVAWMILVAACIIVLAPVIRPEYLEYCVYGSALLIVAVFLRVRRRTNVRGVD
jgi:hypothetical protein